jgi:hypothetical protein
MAMSSFIQLMTESFDHFTFPIWCSLCSRLSLSNSIDCSSDRNLDGILSYLTKRFGGHVIDRDIVSITASAVAYPQDYPLRQVADFENQCHIYTGNAPNSWICYDFKDMQIKVTHYSIRSRCDLDLNHLRSWTLEGSKDGLSWVKLDDRKDDTSLNSAGAIFTFSISAEFEDEFRMIRLRQTGKNSSGNDYLVASAIGFFGVLKELKQ